ncbi:MAG: YfhO family protein, partial [Hyphomicrobiaceae bacterium]|nr:YfhO family protein [Hyphomicrobiaceae bacterium]
NMGQLYIGAVPALALLLGLFSGTLWHREVRFLALALAAALIFALGRYTPLFEPLHAYLPGVALFRRPADAVFLIGFLAAILSGYTVHRLLTIPSPIPPIRLRNAIIATAAVVIVAFAVALWFAVRMDRTGMGARPLILSAIAFLVAAAIIADAVWFNPIRPALGGLLLAGFTVADLAWFNGPSSSTAMKPALLAFLDPRTDNETVAILKEKTAVGAAADPNRRDRVELAGLGFHWPNAPMTHRLDHTLGYNPIRLSAYAEATGAEDTVGLPEQRKFPVLFPSYDSRLADVLGLRFIVSKLEVEMIDRRLKPGRLAFVGPTLDGFVYENPRALPRAVFAANSTAADFAEIARTGTWPDADLSSTVLLSPFDAKASGLVASPGPGEVRIVSYRNTEVVVDADSRRGGYVVLHDVWHPWWTATLDGAPAPILKANVLFRAVRVPPGRHTVRFAFEPIRGLLGVTPRF